MHDAPLVYSEFTMDHHADACALWQRSEGVALTVGDAREDLARYLARNPGMSFVCHAREPGVLVGTVLGGHDGRRGFLYHLAVDRAFQGRGIARELVRRSLETLQAAGLQRCMIMVKSTNDGGQDFWSHAGWTRRGDLLMYSINTKA